MGRFVSDSGTETVQLHALDFAALCGFNTLTAKHIPDRKARYITAWRKLVYGEQV